MIVFSIYTGISDRIISVVWKGISSLPLSDVFSCADLHGLIVQKAHGN